MFGRLVLWTCLCLGWFISPGCGGDPVDPLPEDGSGLEMPEDGDGLGISREPLVEDFEPLSTIRGSVVALHVHGQNFDEGSRVDLLLSGDVIGEVQTLSTRFVSPEELVADISIADNAPAGAYEVQVTTSGGKRGIPIEDFTILPVDSTTTLIISADMDARRQRIFVFRAGEGVRNAVVTVNGVLIPHTIDVGCSAGPCRDSLYENWLPEAVAPGSPLLLEVRVGGITVEAIGKVPEAPVVTAPASGSEFALTDSITVIWSSTTDPDGFEATFGFRSWCCTSLTASGTARELKFAASDVASSYMSMEDDVFGVFAFNDGSFTGPVDPGSYMRIRNGASPDTEITIGPAPSSGE